ncbi:hypothetical protein [Caulobacter sp. 1776]
MNRSPNPVPWGAVVGVLVILGIASLASCQSLRRLKPPYHEPAVAPLDRR